MSPGEPPPALRAARAARGWSQVDAARALAELARARGVAAATPASLKTQLSRWENGRATPDAPYRALLAELYGRADLGLDPERARATADPARRLRARVAAAAAVDAEVVALWGDQLAAAQGLDDRLGGTGAAEAVGALLTQLGSVLPHLPDPPRRRAVATLLARAGLLAGAQALDAGDPDTAAARFARAAEVAQAAGAPGLVADATVGHAEALVEVGEPHAALAVLEHAPRTSPGRLAAVTAVALAAAGDGPGARRALAADGARPPRPGDGSPAGPTRSSPGPPGRTGGRAGPGPADRTAPPAGLLVELAPGTSADPDHRHGRALALLGDPAAVAHLDRALAAGPRSVRERATLHAELARALSAAGRGEEADEHAATARRLALRAGARRILRLLDDHGAPPRPAVPSSSSAAR